MKNDRITYWVIDTTTGKTADIEQIAKDEEWARGLMYCDMDGFAIEEDGTLLLLDECGKYVCCPDGRFDIVFIGLTVSES